MIREHKMNVELSKKAYEDCKTHILPKQCYDNIWNMISMGGYSQKLLNDGWKIAYGFVSIFDNMMARHCYFIDADGNAVDPTLAGSQYFKEEEPKSYISMHLYDLKGYFDALEMYRNTDLLMHLMSKEKHAYEWASNNNKVLCG